jgi:hypothetical protein
MPQTFSLASSLRVVPSWSDDLTTTTVTDTVTALLTLAMAGGTGNDQANGFWKDVFSINASAQYTIDLRALPLNVFGGTGNLSLSSVKLVLIENRSSTAGLSISTSVSNRWANFAADTLVLPAAGVLYATAPKGGWATTTTNKVLSITNNGGAAASVAAYIVGVKT